MKDCYKSFLENKSVDFINSGFIVDSLNDELFAFQKDIVKWALAKGKAAIFADCGLGKTFMQLEWANNVHKKEGGSILILAPLSVAEQTKQEGKKFGIDVNICKTLSDIKEGINITNYEKLKYFKNVELTGVVLDESSILKSFTGKTRNDLIDMFCKVPFRLACTATPAPNDYMELGNHAEFLGVMGRNEMLSMFFTHDGGNTSKWRLKGHAEEIYWQWLSSWAAVISKPQDLGYECEGYELPTLSINQVIVDGDEVTNEPMTLTQRRQARRDTLAQRCRSAADLVNNSDEQWLVWCDLNDESSTLTSMINDCVEVRGSDKPEHKQKSMLGFSNGSVKCLVTKPSIAGFGMNWQQCRNMVFVGLSDSYEAYYQAVRRCWRFGQEHPVNVYIVISSREGAVKDNIERKQADSYKMQQAMLTYTKESVKNNLLMTKKIKSEYNAETIMILPKWEEFAV